MKKVIIIWLALASIILTISACKDPLGLDEFNRTLIEGDTLALFDTNIVIIYDTITVDEIIMRDSVVIDTIYVEVDESRFGMRSKDVKIIRSEFVELYYSGESGQGIRHNWDGITNRIEISVSYVKGFPQMDAYLVMTNRKIGNLEYERQRKEYFHSFYINAKELIPFRQTPYYLTSHINGNRWSKLIYKENDGSNSEFSGIKSNMTLQFIETEIDNEGRLMGGILLLEARIPNKFPNLQRNFVFLGLLKYEVYY